MTSKDDHFASSDSLRDDHCPMNNKIWTTVDVDLVNGSNTWLPAYGFQHHHNYFEPTHEESRINETNVIASTDFLETILEETSDDLQSDSDHSDDSTTYWLGSDSETESVIHITNNQQMAGERLSESDSKSNNSVIPKKRRRKTNDKRDCYCNYSSSTTTLSDNNRWVASSRSSSRSSTSSRSSSLVQFENLERTCATVSPSGYSYDSLEYSNNSNSCFENTSPDSLEDMENVTVNQTKSFGVNNKKTGLISKIRPYRSFESLNTCHHENKMFRELNDEDDDEDEDDDIDDEPFERNLRREIYDYENDYDENNSEGDDINNYHSVDWKNTIDLREIGLETNREAVLLDLARSQIKSSLDPLYSRLNIDTANNMAMGVASGEEQRWSNETSANFNFRFTNKSQSVPSIPSCLDALLSDCVFDSRPNNTDNYNTSRHSLNVTSSIRNFENFARVASVPGDLNYFGVISPSDEALVSRSNGINAKYHHEMADDISEMAHYPLQNEESSNNSEANETIKKSTVKTQDHGFDVMLMENNIDAVVDEAIRQFKNQVEEATNFEIDNDEFFTNEGYRVLSSSQQRPRRVKNNASYELAQQWEINEKDLGLSLPSNSCSTSGLKKRVMNNASYELAQQSDYVKALQLTSKTFQRMDACDELHEPQNEEKNIAFNQYDGKSDLSKIKYESMNDNYKNISHNDNKQKQQHDNLFDQIKKNSVPFSIYGEIGSCKNNSIGINSMTDDEIDLAYLETKYISSNKPDDNLIFNVNANASNNDDKCSNSELMCGKISTINRHNYLNKCINSDEMALVVDTSDLDADEQRLGNVAVAGNHQTVNVFADEGNETQPMTVNSSSKIEEAETDSHWHRQYTSDSVNNASPLSSRVGKVIVARVLDNKTDYRSEDDCGNEKREEEEEEKITRKKEKNKLSTEENDDKQLDVSNSEEAEKEEEVKKQKNKEDMVLMEKDEKQERIQAICENNSDNRRSLSVAPIPSPGSSRSNNDLRIKNNLMMRYPISDVPDETKKKSGLGGFFQRFSRLRFSGRSSKTPRMDAKKIRGGNIETVEAKLLGDKRNLNSQPTIESNYTIIPLHPPDGKTKREENIHQQQQQQHESLFRNCAISNVENTTTTHDQRTYVGENGRSSVYSSKPPLPPLHHHSMRACSSSSRNMSFSDGGGSVGTRRRAITDLGSPVNIEMAKARAMQHHHHDTIVQQNERPIGLLETDLDADIPNICDESGSSINDGNTTSGKKTRSLLNLNHSSHQGRENVLLRVPQSPGQILNRNTSDKTDHAVVVGPINHRPHKSMEFLLDKENLHFIKPPENELQKVMGAAPERVPSEHELRVQRSLQRLNVPDWYKNSPAARDGFRLKRHSDASQHGGWRSLGSKTTSLSSLSSSSNLRQPNSTMDYTGPLSSPTPPPVFSRWSTSLLNSAGNMPITNNTSSLFTHRQPYLGWRSQERLANPRTPAERLAQGILPQIESKKQQQQINQQLDVRNSIKEVTSAIVHYVQSGQETLVTNNSRNLPGSRANYNDNNNDNNNNNNSNMNNDNDGEDVCGIIDSARSTGPRGEAAKLCWMESSFVGSRPVDSPETPMSLATDTECCCTDCNATSTKSCTCADQSMASGLYLDLAPSDTSCCPSPSTIDSRQHYQHRHAHQQQQQQQRYYRETSEREQTSAENKDAMSTTSVTTTSTTFVRNKPSPGSTTLEDVLDSLLGLPSVSSRTPSPSSKVGKSCSDLHQDLQECVKRGTGIMTDVGLRRLLGAVTNPAELKIRRKSEGSDIIVSSSTHGGLPLICNRHVTFDGTGGQTVEKLMVKCRNNKCNNTADIADAKRVFKRCPNCTCLYCSRECRKAHWQRHRMTCLHSRVGALFRQVLSSAQHDVSTLRHISILATQGYAAHGRGAVYCFFSSPKAAEKFISNGFKDLGEPIYVRSSDLLPSEMGTELYGEIMELCKSYDPNTRLVLYVAVCVVSKVPRTVCSDDSGVIKYERQLISRCGKIKLDEKIQKQISPCKDNNTVDVPETLVLTSMPQLNNDSNEENTIKKVREISFTNIKRQLRLRGISLRKHFPQVYKKLCSYVDGSVDQFAPVTIYPRDKVSGKSFMCIIMLDAAPESLQLLPADLSRVKTVDISVIEQE